MSIHQGHLALMSLVLKRSYKADTVIPILQLGRLRHGKVLRAMQTIQDDLKPGGPGRLAPASAAANSILYFLRGRTVRKKNPLCKLTNSMGSMYSYKARRILKMPELWNYVKQGPIFTARGWPLYYFK